MWDHKNCISCRVLQLARVESLFCSSASSCRLLLSFPFHLSSLLLFCVIWFCFLVIFFFFSGILLVRWNVFFPFFSFPLYHIVATFPCSILLLIFFFLTLFLLSQLKWPQYFASHLNKNCFSSLCVCHLLSSSPNASQRNEYNYVPCYNKKFP